MQRQTLEQAPQSIPVSPAEPMPRQGVGTFRSLRHRDFRLLWAGILGVSAGQWIEQTAVSWVVLERTDSATMVGLVAGARALPSLALAPLGGIIADRFERRNVLIISQIAAALLAAMMAALDLSGALELWHIFALVLGFGILWALNNPVRHTFIPQLVPRSDLMNAVALNSAGFNLSRSIGPFIGAALLGGLGFGVTYAIAAALYAAVLVFTVGIRTRTRPSAAARETVVESLREGVRYLRRDRVILTLIILALFPVTVGLPYIALMPVFARDVLGKGELAFGTMLGFTGFGSLAGTLVLASLNLQRRGGLLLMAVALAFGGSLVVFSLSESYGLSLSILFFTGMFSMLYLSLSNTLIQMLVDDKFRGRVMSILVMEFGLTPLGAVGAGVLAEATSPATAVMAMGATLSAGAAGAIVALREIRQLDLSRPRG